MERMQQKLDFNLRSTTVNIMDILDFVEGQFKAGIESSCSVNTTYDGLSNDTLEDYLICHAQLTLLLKLDLLNVEEKESMREMAEQYRLRALGRSELNP